MINYSRYTPSVVLITGATGDFGKAFAARFAALGCSLILHGRTQKKLHDLCQLYPSAHPILFDITDKITMKKALDSLPDTHKNIDLLINNAGLALGLEKAYEANLNDWETMIDVDVKGLATITRFVIEGMATRKSGHIINIGSTAGNYPYAGGNVYCGVKAFVKQFSLALRADLVGTNIRVTNVEPGQVETQFSSVRFHGDDTRAQKVYEGTNSLQATDVAESVVWAATLPPHMNINRLEMMPTSQSFAGLAVERKPV